LSHKTKQPLIHLGILRNVNNFYKTVDIFQTFKIFFQQKNGKLRCSIIFMSMQFYSILISVLTVDRASTLSVKKWEEEAPYQRNEATI
jgi:hypothetical protein